MWHLEAEALDGHVPVWLRVWLHAGDGREAIDEAGGVGAHAGVFDRDEEGEVVAAAAGPLGLEGVFDEAEGVEGLEGGPGGFEFG